MQTTAFGTLVAAALIASALSAQGRLSNWPSCLVP
jgi:hypothetical protein